MIHEGWAGELGHLDLIHRAIGVSFYRVNVNPELCGSRDINRENTT
jgi:hypothetical protein